MKMAPVVIFGFNRADHLKKTINALEQNDGAIDSDIYIFIDGARNEEEKKQVNEVVDVAEKFRDNGNFKSVTIEKKDKNYGLAQSVVQGVSKVIEMHGKVIVLEDDIVTSKDFLKFMNDSLLFYRNELKIWSISGYTFNMPSLCKQRSDVYLGYRASSWGWATWIDRWETVDWKVQDYNKFRWNLYARYKFNRGGTNMADMLDRQMAGEINSWAIRWCYEQYKQNKLTVFPCKSKVINIGLDGSGTHCTENDNYDSNEFGETPYTLDFPTVDKKLMTEFRKMTGLRLVSRVKRFCIYNILKRKKA